MFDAGRSVGVLLVVGLAGCSPRTADDGGRTGKTSQPVQWGNEWAGEVANASANVQSWAKSVGMIKNGNPPTHLLPANNVHMWAPAGSPVTYEMSGTRKPRAKTTSARTAQAWAAASDATLAGYLPIRLGTDASGVIQGEGITVSSATQARSLLLDTSETPRANLVKQLLAARLNLVQACLTIPIPERTTMAMGS